MATRVNPKKQQKNMKKIYIYQACKNAKNKMHKNAKKKQPPKKYENKTQDEQHTLSLICFAFIASRSSIAYKFFLTCSKASVVFKHGVFPSLAWKAVRQWSNVAITCSLFAPSCLNFRFFFASSLGLSTITMLPSTDMNSVTPGPAGSGVAPSACPCGEGGREGGIYVKTREIYTPVYRREKT